MTSSDYLHKAFLLAKRANSRNIRPNPFVGAIVVSEHGEIIGSGYHQQYGGPHAEVFAIQEALSHQNDLSKCTLYVSLEPCSHTGKTPPCTELILKHKIPRVVIGSMDPNPLVSGASYLAEKGIIIEQCLLEELLSLNDVFFLNQQLKRPKYILKSATTLNGKIADRQGESKWISNAQSRDFVHQFLRKNVDAILTTAKTVIKDNATMNCRVDGQDAEEVNLIVIDKDLSLLKDENKKLNIFYKRTKTKIYLVTPLSDESFEKYDIQEHIKIVSIPMPNGICNLDQLSSYLLENQICEVLIEGGGILNATFMKADLVDELYLFICPSILLDNNALGIFNSNDEHDMANSLKLKLVSTEAFDSDVLLRYKRLH